MTVQAADGSALTPFGVAIDADSRGRIALSHAIGVDPSTLWRWMTGRSRPRSESARRQAALVLGRSVVELWPAQAEASDQNTVDADTDHRQEADAA